MKIEREREVAQRRKEQQQEVQKIQRRKAEITEIKAKLFSLFGPVNPHHRGKALEEILNRLFKVSGILVKEAFTMRGTEGEGVVEQIDGAIELNGEFYLVEMKWHKERLGVDIVSSHLVRVFNRGQARGIIISASGYTEPAVTTCRDALSQITVVLCELSELVSLLEEERDVKSWLLNKIQAAIIEKNPFALL